MRVQELYTRPTLSMKDISLLKDEIRELKRVTGSFNVNLNIVTLTFMLHGVEGTISLEALQENGSSAQQVLKNKLAAVGRTQLGGSKPRSMSHISSIMNQGIGNRAIQILMNGLSIRSIRYGDIDFRAGRLN